MRLAILGCGYVGLVSGACFAEFGHDVVAIDNDGARIAALKRGEVPIYEPGLKDILRRNLAAGRLSFAEELPPGLFDAEAIFIAVGTPSRRGDGHADLDHVFAAARAIADRMTKPIVVATKSTVPVGTGRKIAALIGAASPRGDFAVVSNPEFLREGAAIADFMRPDRVVIGADDDRAREIMQRIYRPLYLIETPLLFTSLESAELIKYAANAFLAMKIGFINEMADLCERLGADVHDIARGIGLDGRIGPKFLHPSPGFGGSCFPKDARALIATAKDAGAPLTLIETTLAGNEARKRAMIERIRRALGGDLAGKTIAILGLTFKPATDDMREAASLVILPGLAALGARIRAHDPAGMKAAARLMPDLEYCPDAYTAMTGADGLVILTEWNNYRALDLARVKALLRAPVIVDLRNIYRPEEMRGLGFVYTSLGRP